MLLTSPDDDPRTAVTVERFVARHLHASRWHVMRCEHAPIAHLYAGLGALVPPHPANRGLQLSPIDSPEHGMVYPDQLTDAAIARAHALIPQLRADRDHLHHVVQTYWERTAAAPSHLAGEVLGDYDPVTEDELNSRRVNLLIDILDPAGLLRLMDWLRPDFAHRRGWPDLLTWRTDDEGTITEHRFVEVKSRRDRWSQDQKDVIAANASHGFGMDIHLVKVHAAGEIPRPSDADLGLTETYPGNCLPGRRPLAPLWPAGQPEPARALAVRIRVER